MLSRKGLSFYLGLILIIGGFLSFVLTVITAKEMGTSITRHNLLVALGCFLIVLGSISMYFFIKKEDKKKKITNNKSNIEVV